MKGAPQQTQKSQNSTDENPPSSTEYNAGDPNQVAERKSKSQRIEAQRIDGLRLLMSSREGRIFMWELLKFCKVGQQPFAADSHVTAFHCGEINVGNKLLADLQKHRPEDYLTMIKEGEPT